MGGSKENTPLIMIPWSSGLNLQLNHYLRKNVENQGLLVSP